MRREIISIDEGIVEITFPEKIKEASVKDIEKRFRLIIKKLKRWSAEPQFNAPPG